MRSPFLAAFTLEDLAKGAEVKLFKPGSHLKYYFAIKVGTDLEWECEIYKAYEIKHEA